MFATRLADRKTRMRRLANTRLGEQPGAVHRGLSDGEKAAILILRGKHIGIDAIADKLNRSPGTIKNFLDVTRRLAESSGVQYDYKDDLKLKSIDAVRAGLDDEKDNYKRANIGLGVLKGIGEFANETGVQINNLIAACPPEWASRYLSNEEIVDERSHDDAQKSAGRIG